MKFRISKPRGFVFSKVKRIGFSVRQYFVLLLICVVLFTVFRIQQINQTAADRQRDIIRGMQTNLSQANLIIDNYYANIRYLMLSLSTREDIFGKGSAQPERILQSILRNNELARVLYTANENGDIYTSWQALYDVTDTTEVRQMMEKARKSPNIILYSEPYHSHMVASYSICAAIAFNSGNTVVALEMNLQALYDSLQALLGGTGKSFLVSSNTGNIFLFDRSAELIPLQSPVYPLRVAPEYERLVKTNSFAQMELTHFENISGVSGMLSSANNLHWKVLSIYDTSLTRADMDIVYRNIYISSIGWLIFLAAVLLIVSILFTKPIRDLAKKMEGVSSVEDLTIVQTTREDEIGRLRNSYNRLINRIHQLMDDIRDTERKKKEYEIKTLQNQIGPHFLQNTLSCISCLIRQGDLKLAEDSMQALSSLLAYGFDNIGEFVVLEDELQKIQQYVFIQRMRYGDIFTFDVKTTPEAMKCLLPKLTIQPVLENMFSHGILPMEEGTGSIAIRTFHLNGSLLIRVYDNGVGIEKSRLKSILSGKESIRKAGRASGIGLSNVHERLRLIFGEAYGVKIKSKPGKGTIVQLKIPYQTV